MGFRDAAVVDAQGAPVNERPSSQLIANLITLAHGEGLNAGALARIQGTACRLKSGACHDNTSRIETAWIFPGAAAKPIAWSANRSQRNSCPVVDGG
jgi:hypothetical protein